MERNVDLRRAGFSGLQRRRSGFRDSREEDGGRQVELQEMVRLRDREMLLKKDRDREFSKRRRVDRQPRNGTYRELESSDSSEEESDEEEDQPPPKVGHQNRMNPPPPAASSARSSHRRSLRTLRSTPAMRTAVDELFGFPIPRRARSSSFRRVHEHWSSGSGGLGDELNRRRFSSSPATASPVGAGGSSPSSSGGSSMKKKRKSVEPRNRSLNANNASNSKSAVTYDEFEVAEALFDLMKQSQSSKSSKNADTSSPADDEGKRLKVDDVNNGGFSAQIEKSIKADAESKSSLENGEKEEEMADEQVQDDKEKEACTKASESPSSCVKVNGCKFQDPTVTKTNDGAVSVENKKEGKLEIDLMAPPDSASFQGKELVVDTASDPMVISQGVDKEHGSARKEVSPASVLVQEETNGTSSSGQLPNLDLERFAREASTSNGNKQQQKNHSVHSFSPFPSMGGWPGVVPHRGYMAPLQAVVPVGGSGRPSAAVVQTPQFRFSEPGRKRCTTHQYIALNIQSHQQLVKKTLTPGFSGSTSNLYGMKQLNLHPKSQPENLFSSGVNGRDKSSDVTRSLNTSTSNIVVPQQALDHASAQKFLQGPAYIFPFGHHQTTAAAQSGNTSGHHLSTAVIGDASMPSNAALNLGFPAMSFNNQNMPPTNEALAPYMAMLQKNGFQFPMPPNVALQKNGTQVPVVPFFNSSFYSSPVFNISPNQQHISLPHALAQPTSQNTNTSGGSSTRKPPLGQKQTGANLSEGKSSADVGFLIPSTGQMFSNVIQPVNGSQPKNVEQQQKGSTGRVDFTQQAALAMSFGSNSSMNSGLNFHMLPDMSQNAYQKSFQSSDGKSPIASANPQDEPKSIFGKAESNSGQSLNFNKSSSSEASATMGASMFDGLARNLNMVPSSNGKQALPSSSASIPIPNFHQHQHHQQLIQLQKHHMQQMQLNGAKDGMSGPFLSSFPNGSNIFGRPENSAYTQQWDNNNMPRTTAPDGSTLLMSFPPQLKGSQGQTHISFGNMPGSSGSFQGQQHTGSSSNSPNPTNAPGSLRNPSTPSQQADVPQQNGSKSSSPACRRNVPSILSTCPSQPSELKY